MEFNGVVGVDLIQVNMPNLGEYLMLNCLCWGTDLQIVWSRWWTNKLLRSMRPLQKLGCLTMDRLGWWWPTKAESSSGKSSPIVWAFKESQRTSSQLERRGRMLEQRRLGGGIYKSRLETVIHEAGVTTEEELMMAVSETAMVHNRYYKSWIYALPESLWYSAEIAGVFVVRRQDRQTADLGRWRGCNAKILADSRGSWESMDEVAR
eukprot:s1110_g5.t1